MASEARDPRLDVLAEIIRDESMREHGRPDVAGDLASLNAADPLRQPGGEVERLREALESLFPAEDGYGEAFDELIDRGLLVEVAVPDEEVQEVGYDMHYVWAWRKKDDDG